MKLHLSYGSLALLLLLVGCSSDDSRTTDSGMMGTDAGMMGTDAGMMRTDSGMMRTDSGPADAGTPPILDAGPPDMNAAMRITASTRAIRMTSCGCDMGAFGTAEECAGFDRPAEADTCREMAYSAHFTTVGPFFTCQAQINEEFQTCFAAAACDETAADACEAAANEFGCPTVSEEEANAYQATLDACEASMIVGDAGTCPDAADAVNTTGAAVFMGTTIGAGSDLDAPADCITVAGGGGSPDRAFLWAAPAAGDYTFDTIGSAFDTVLYLRNSCEDATDLGCNDDAADDDLRSTVTATLTEGQEVLVVVEGFSTGNAGNFVVNINAAE